MGEQETRQYSDGDISYAGRGYELSVCIWNANTTTADGFDKAWAEKSRKSLYLDGEEDDEEGGGDGEGAEEECKEEYNNILIQYE